MKRPRVTRHAFVEMHFRLSDAANVRHKDIRAYLNEAARSCIRDLPDVMNLSNKIKGVACTRVRLSKP